MNGIIMAIETPHANLLLLSPVKYQTSNHRHYIAIIVTFINIMHNMLYYSIYTYMQLSANLFGFSIHWEVKNSMQCYLL